VLKQFDRLMLQSLNRTVRFIFGESASQIVWDFLDRHQSLKRDIGQEIEAFCAFLDALLGSERAQVVYVASLRFLHHELQQEYARVQDYLAILDELDKLRLRLLASPGGQTPPLWS
jgi:hypothetical protein